MTDEQLHAYAREVAATLRDSDKKQLRFNDIVEVAKEFYPTNVAAGVRELVESCDREVAEDTPNPLYVSKAPMWKSLRDNYGWMLA